MVLLALNCPSNLEFEVRKKLYKLAKLGGGVIQAMPERRKKCSLGPLDASTAHTVCTFGTVCTVKTDVEQKCYYAHICI